MLEELSPGEAAPLKVQVIGPDPLARGGLEALLRSGGLRTGSHEPDVVLWDLGTGRSLADAPRVDADRPLLALVPDERAARHALSRGASGVLDRGTDPARLVAAVHALANDLVVIDDLLAAGLLPDAAWPAAALTPREAEVLTLLAEGLTNAAIADELDLSPHTVRFHVRALLDKLEARNRAEAVTRAVRMGLLRT